MFENETFRDSPAPMMIVASTAPRRITVPLILGALIAILAPAAVAAQPICSLPEGHDDYCKVCGPCPAGMGDCDRSDECLAGLTCRHNIGESYGWADRIDVCAETDCVRIRYRFHPTEGQVRRYKINPANWQHIADGNYTEDQLVQAIILAADTWNEQSPAATFLFDGLTEVAEIPRFHAGDGVESCLGQGIDYSLFHFDANAESGGMSSKCVDKPRRGDREIRAREFRIFMPGAAGFFLGEADDPTFRAGKYDFVKGIMHELGHALELGHPAGGAPSAPPLDFPGATMRLGTKQINASRDLWQWDLECASSYMAEMHATPVVFTQSAKGKLSREPRIGRHRATRGSAAFYYDADGGVDGRGYSYMQAAGAGAALRWRQLASMDTSHLSPSGGAWKLTTHHHEPASIGLREVTWLERPERQRIHYVAVEDHPVPHATSSTHVLRYTQWDPKDPDAPGEQGLYHYCPSMAGATSCGGPVLPVRTGKPVGFAWDPVTEQSVVAWANQNRASNADSRRILLSVGRIDESTLRTPTATPLRTRVGPSVACRPAAGDFNCILVFVDEDAATGEVAVRRFRNVPGALPESPEPELSTIDTGFGAKTGSSIAAWYNTGTSKFYLAVKTSSPSQPVYLYSSPDGDVWSSQGQLKLPGVAMTAPAAVSHHVGDSNLITVTVLEWQQPPEPWYAVCLVPAVPAVAALLALLVFVRHLGNAATHSR